MPSINSPLNSEFSYSRNPETNALSPNLTRQFENFHISYNRSSADYGVDTTAIVLVGRVFFLLCGDHANALAERASSHGINGCIQYFADNIASAHAISEHLMAIGQEDDVWSLHGTTLEVIGQENIDRLISATK